jgi:glycosyltransferase involved in cell wall biosynthesis
MLISVCTIVKNEIGMLPGMLDSLDGLADEFIVLDTGSTDGTLDITHDKMVMIPSAQFTHDTPRDVFRLDYARNEAMSHAKGDWLFVFDADCRLHSGDALKVRAMFASGTYNDCDAVQVRPDPGTVFVCHPICVRRSLGAQYRGRTHERLQLPKDVRMGMLPDTITFTHLRTPEAEGAAASRAKRLYYIDQIKRDIGDCPDDWYLHYLLVQEYKMLDRWRDAHDEALATLAMPNVQPWAMAWLGYVVGGSRFNLGAHDDAILCLERNLAEFPNHTDTKLALAEMRKRMMPVCS